MITLTTKHTGSLYGVPVFADGNRLVDHADGLRQIRAEWNLTRQELAAICGVASRTIEGYEYGKPVTVTPLLRLKEWLALEACRVRVLERKRDAMRELLDEVSAGEKKP